MHPASVTPGSEPAGSPAEPSPRASVVVPVRDRRDLLRELLDALARQTYRDFEVVIVDDGSADGSGDEAKAIAASQGLRLRVERTAGVGAVEARRIGVAASRGSVLAFTDSDCAPDPVWLAEGVAAIDAGADLVVGPTVPAGPVRALERSVEARSDDGLCATCNVFYRRAAYEDAGGFSEAGRTLGFRWTSRAKELGFGEDTILAWRIRRSGRYSFVPGAVVRHAVLQPKIREILWRTWVAGAFPALIKSVPELRRTLVVGRIWLGSPRRAPVYTLIVGAALPWRVWLAPVAGAWWLFERARAARRSAGSRPRRLVAIPVEMASDVLTAAALVGGSIRSRTVVL
jgi:glycosyltransferase involved in cell wall biosynthesis